MTLTASPPAAEPPLAPDSPLAAWGCEQIVAAVDTLVTGLPAARDASDIEGLHDLRVASRRLGAALRIFAPCFAGPAFDRLNREARVARRRSGEVRDLDVLIAFLEAERAGLTGTARLAMRFWLAGVERQRAERRQRLGKTIDWLESRHLDEQARDLVRLGTAAALLPLTFRQAAPPVLLEGYREFYGYLEYVERPEAETELHAMRIAVKRLRYAMEIFAPAFKSRLKRSLVTMKRLQEALGDLHDSDVRRYALRDLIDRPLDRATLRAAAPATAADIRRGLPLLLEWEERRRAEIYQEFRSLWHQLKRKGFPETLLARLQSPDAPAR